MKLKEFRKMFRGLPEDTEVMLVAEWDDWGTPTLCDANRIEHTHDEPQGDYHGCNIVYIINDPDKEY